MPAECRSPTNAATIAVLAHGPLTAGAGQKHAPAIEQTDDSHCQSAQSSWAVTSDPTGKSFGLAAG